AVLRGGLELGFSHGIDDRLVDPELRVDPLLEPGVRHRPALVHEHEDDDAARDPLLSGDRGIVDAGRGEQRRLDDARTGADEIATPDVDAASGTPARRPPGRPAP